MSCVIYKNGERVLVDPVALEGMLKLGWSVTKDKTFDPPSGEQFQEFLNMHEELKRISEKAMSVKDNHIIELSDLNVEIKEELERVEGTNKDLLASKQYFLDQLGGSKDWSKQLETHKNDEIDKGNEIPSLTYEPIEEEGISAQPYFEGMNLQDLKKYAKHAGIIACGNMRKADLITVLNKQESIDVDAA